MSSSPQWGEVSRVIYYHVLAIHATLPTYASQARDHGPQREDEDAMRILLRGVRYARWRKSMRGLHQRHKDG